MKSLLSTNSDSNKNKQLERAPRVRLLPLHDIHFRLKLPFETGPIDISNLSETGLGLFRHSIQTWPAMGSFLEGTLYLQAGAKTGLPLKLKCVRMTDFVVGTEIVDKSPDFSQALQAYFKSELSATRLSEVNPRSLKSSEEGNCRWFYGTNNCDLYLVEKEKIISFFAISYFGNYVEGGEHRPTRFGIVEEQDNPNAKPKHEGSDLITWEKEGSFEAIESFVRFVENIAHLSPEEKSSICRMLYRGQPNEKSATA